MLTVDYERLGLGPGDLLMDLGAGLGRHTFEAVRRGARSIPVDLRADDLGHIRATVAAMNNGADPPRPPWGGSVAGDALHLPFGDATFDRVIASEVLEHIPDDRQAMGEIARVTRPGGTIAVTVPRFWPEAVCWGLSSTYRTAAGGHVRIYRTRQLTKRLARTGLEPLGAHHAHALHAPYWWLRCAVGPEREDSRPVKLYRRFLEWDIVNAPRLVRGLERRLDPICGKSLVVYARKPEAVRAAS